MNSAVDSWKHVQIQAPVSRWDDQCLSNISILCGESWVRAGMHYMEGYFINYGTGETIFLGGSFRCPNIEDIILGTRQQIP